MSYWWIVVGKVRVGLFKSDNIMRVDFISCLFFIRILTDERNEKEMGVLLSTQKTCGVVAIIKPNIDVF